MIRNRRTPRHAATAVALALALAGCATTSAPARLQTIRVSAVTEKGAAIDSAQCTLRNGSGDWQVAAPGAVQVVVDSQPLKLHCDSSDGRWTGEAIVEPRSSRKTSMLVGAGVGLLAGAAAGESQRRHDTQTDKGFLAQLNILGGAILGAALGTGAGALAAPEVSYADAVRVALKPVPKPDQ